MFFTLCLATWSDRVFVDQHLSFVLFIIQPDPVRNRSPRELKQHECKVQLTIQSSLGQLKIQSCYNCRHVSFPEGFDACLVSYCSSQGSFSPLLCQWHEQTFVFQSGCLRIALKRKRRYILYHVLTFKFWPGVFVFRLFMWGHLIYKWVLSSIPLYSFIWFDLLVY